MRAPGSSSPISARSVTATPSRARFSAVPAPDDPTVSCQPGGNTLAGSGGGNRSTRIIVFHDAAPNTTTLPALGRRPSITRPRSPTLVVDDVGEGGPAAGLLRPGQVIGVRGIAERQDVLAVPVVRVAEELPGEVVLVHGRGHAPDPELPGGEHHVPCG